MQALQVSAPLVQSLLHGTVLSDGLPLETDSGRAISTRWPRQRNGDQPRLQPTACRSGTSTSSFRCKPHRFLLKCILRILTQVNDLLSLIIYLIFI